MTTPKSKNDDTGSDDRAQAGSVAPAAIDRPDGGPGSHTEGQTGGVASDPASGGVPEDADADARDDGPSR